MYSMSVYTIFLINNLSHLGRDWAMQHLLNGDLRQHAGNKISGIVLAKQPLGAL